MKKSVMFAPALPAYASGSIVNLMHSILAAMGGKNDVHAPLKMLPPDEITRARNIVLIVVDGLGHHLLQRHAHGTLARYQRGAITSVFPTTTAAAITSFLTGLAPQQHGITGWFTHLEEIHDVAMILPFKRRGTERNLRDMGILPRAIFDSPSIFDRINATGTLVIEERLIGSEYTRVTAGRAERRPYKNLAGFFAQITHALRAREGRQYIYAYWPELDHLAHQHGSASGAVHAHLAEWEAAFERFLATPGDNTVVIVTADHGLIDTTPSHTILLDQHPALAATLRLPLCGEPRVAFCYVKKNARNDFERYVTTALDHCCTLIPGAALLEQGWFGPGEAHPKLRSRAGDYALLMKDNYVIKDYVAGEKPFAQIGVHGGLSPSELLVPLCVIPPRHA